MPLPLRQDLHDASSGDLYTVVAAGVS